MTAEGSSSDISSYYESICYANAVKKDKSEKIGLVVKRSSTWDTLYISAIKDTSKFANSKLQIGMVILTINGMKCPKTVKEIQKVMKETEGALTIMAAMISKEISIVESSNSPAHSPVRSSTVAVASTAAAAKVTTSAEGSHEMGDPDTGTPPEEYPLSFRTESYVPGNADDDDNNTTTIVTPQFPLHEDKKILMDESSDHLTASTEPSEVQRSESLEMSLSGHQNTFRSDAPHPISPSAGSPGSSPASFEPERKVSESGQRYSPVSICSIDHTGNIIVTPKESPKPTVSKDVSDHVKMPSLAKASSIEEEEEKKHDPMWGPIHSDHEPNSLLDEEEEEEDQASNQSSESMEEPDSKPPASPVVATAKPKSKKQQQQEQDDRAKKRASRGPRMAPGVAPGAAPGAYHVSSRPSAGSKAAHSLSPNPTTTTTTTSTSRPGAHRVAGVNNNNSRSSDPSGMVVPLPPSLETSKTIASAPARAQQRSMGPRIESLSPPPRIQTTTSSENNNMPPPHPDIPRPGAHRIVGPNRRRASGGGSSPYRSRSSSPYASASSPAIASQYRSGGPVDVDDLENDNASEEEEILQGVGVGMGLPVGQNQSSPYNKAPSIDGDLSKDSYDNFSKESYDLDGDEFSRGSIEVSEAPEMSIITSDDDIVIAAEVVQQDHPEIVEDRIRKQIMQETARASVVMVEHGGNDNNSFREEELEMHKPKNVKEKLFGGGGKGRDVSQELSMNPDQYIRKRDHLPWTVKRNTTTGMWIASVVTDQKAYDEGNKKEQERSMAVFSAKTEREANETGLAMATPYLQPVKNHPICVMCSSKFAVFNRPHNCRNCGVVVCSKCTVIWSSKRLPSTYQTSKSTHSVCLACDWSANNFQDAITKGKLRAATKLYETGNVNLRSPYISSKKKSGQEIMYPIHMAIVGGNVDLARWLCKDRYVPVTNEVKSRGALKSLPISTSKGRTPLKLAIKQKNHDMLKFLVAEMEVSLFDEDIKGDYRYLLAHLSNTLHRAPYEAEIATMKKRQGGTTTTSSSISQSSPKSTTRTSPPTSMEAQVGYAVSTSGSGGRSVGTHHTQASSRADSRGEC